MMRLLWAGRFAFFAAGWLATILLADVPAGLAGPDHPIWTALDGAPIHLLQAFALPFSIVVGLIAPLPPFFFFVAGKVRPSERNLSEAVGCALDLVPDASKGPVALCTPDGWPMSWSRNPVVARIVVDGGLVQVEDPTGAALLPPFSAERLGRAPALSQAMSAARLCRAVLRALSLLFFFDGGVRSLASHLLVGAAAAAAAGLPLAVFFPSGTGLALAAGADAAGLLLSALSILKMVVEDHCGFCFEVDASGLSGHERLDALAAWRRTTETRTCPEGTKTETRPECPDLRSSRPDSPPSPRSSTAHG